MKTRRHTPEQIIGKLAEGDKLLAQDKTIEKVARQLELGDLPSVAQPVRSPQS